MITVSISINGKTISARTATNVSQGYGLPYGKGLQKYLVDDGSVVECPNEFGVVKLAKKLLDTIKEQK